MKTNILQRHLILRHFYVVVCMLTCFVLYYILTFFMIRQRTRLASRSIYCLVLAIRKTRFLLRIISFYTLRNKSFKHTPTSLFTTFLVSLRQGGRPHRHPVYRLCVSGFPFWTNGRIWPPAHTRRHASDGTRQLLFATTVVCVHRSVSPCQPHIFNVLQPFHIF